MDEASLRAEIVWVTHILCETARENVVRHTRDRGAVSHHHRANPRPDRRVARKCNPVLAGLRRLAARAEPRWQRLD